MMKWLNERRHPLSEVKAATKREPVEIVATVKDELGPTTWNDLKKKRRVTP
jgi:hypothetical protein